MIRGTLTSVSATTKSLGNSSRQMLSPKISVSRPAARARPGTLGRPDATLSQLWRTSKRSGNVPVAIERMPAVLMLTGLVRTRPEAAAGCACRKDAKASPKNVSARSASITTSATRGLSAGSQTACRRWGSGCAAGRRQVRTIATRTPSAASASAILERNFTRFFDRRRRPAATRWLAAKQDDVAAGRVADAIEEGVRARRQTG